jgi:hypothetical protein
MKHIRVTVVFFIFLLIFASTLHPVYAEDVPQPPRPDRLFDRFAVGIFNFGTLIMGTPMHVLRFQQPDSFIAVPNIIEADFLEETEVTIGVFNDTSGDWRSLDDFHQHPLFPGTDFEFSIEIPNYLPNNSIIAQFNPQVISLFREGQLKTTLNFVQANIPSDSILPEKIVLKLNITKYVTAGFLFLPPPGKRIPVLSLLRGAFPAMWFLSSVGLLPGSVPFGLLYGGKRTLDETYYLDIIVKLNRTHLIDIVPPEKIQLEPDKTYSIPIEVRNLGNYLDSFNFRVKTSASKGLLISQPQAVTLEPNEVKYVNLGIVTSENFWDPGTLHSIEIEAFSIYEPTRTNSNTVTVFTQGLYVSEIGMFFIFFIIAILVIIYLFIYLIRKKILGKIIKKPDKPWDVIEEKKYLEKLKKEDKEEYIKVMKMMKDEYQSTLSWYKSFIASASRKKREKRIYNKPIEIASWILKRTKEITKKILNKTKETANSISKKTREKNEKPKSRQQPKKQEIKRPVETTKEEKPLTKERPVVKRKLPGKDNFRKQQIYQKIKYEQEKQKRKMKA